MIYGNTNLILLFFDPLAQNRKLEDRPIKLIIIIIIIIIIIDCISLFQLLKLISLDNSVWLAPDCTRPTGR